MHSVSDGWMIEKQKYIRGIWIRIDENRFSILLKGDRRRLSRIGEDPMCDLQAINVCLILHIAAESVRRHHRGKSIQCEQQQKCGQGRPVLEIPNAPTFS